jgi:hypothetical protein
MKAVETADEVMGYAKLGGMLLFAQFAVWKGVMACKSCVRRMTTAKKGKRTKKVASEEVVPADGESKPKTE